MFTVEINIMQNGKEVPSLFNYIKKFQFVIDYLKDEKVINHFFEAIYPRIREILKEQMKKTFEGEQFHGNQWAELGKDYERRKTNKYGDKKILQATGKLFSDLTSNEFYKIADRKIQFDTSVLPEYWIYHQLGYKTVLKGNIKETKRRSHGSNVLRRTSDRKDKQAYVPRRQFIGITSDAVRLIKIAIKNQLRFAINKAFKGEIVSTGKGATIPNMYEATK